MNTRLAAVRVLTQIISQGRNLTDALAEMSPALANSTERALLQAMAYGVMRWLPRLRCLLRQLMNKPLKQRDEDIHCLLLLGLYQLIYMRTPDHAAVSETVNVTKMIKKPWAQGLVNAVLRNYQRQYLKLQQYCDQTAETRYAHPAWLVDQIRQSWPEHWQMILEANNQPPPMTLRVNPHRYTRDGYQKALQAKPIESSLTPYTRQGLTLADAVNVDALPAFNHGSVSIQDGAAQLAAELLQPQAGERILDACAAPGGKTCHILEIQPELKSLVALDIDKTRLQRIAENLHRLQLGAELKQGDAADPTSWWDGRPFDRILLDAPCSASGVIRRHPDIKSLKRPEDILQLVEKQQHILDALWPLLKSGGMLLYITCSILPQENAQQLQAFLNAHADAIHQPIAAPWGHTMETGRQILPGEEGMDGFYYASLVKA